MPIIKSSYSPKSVFRSGHFQTIYPSLFRKVDFSYDYRERIETFDEDFIDLDWKKNNSNHLIIISHGLEGNSDRHYVKGLAKLLDEHHYDILAWNYRSCSGELNRLARMYHSGDYHDLEYVIDTILPNYDSISLVGYSLGGNLTLMYLANMNDKQSVKINNAVVISVPCDLADSSHELSKFQNKIYMNRFLRHFKKKLLVKSEQFPELINIDGYHKIKNFENFDNCYTSKMHGFKNAEHYWKECSATYSLGRIKKPTLILSALDDPFLGKACYPYKEAEKNKFLSLEIPKYGGHVGFYLESDNYYSDIRSLEFIEAGK